MMNRIIIFNQGYHDFIKDMSNARTSFDSQTNCDLYEAGWWSAFDDMTSMNK